MHKLFFLFILSMFQITTYAACINDTNAYFYGCELSDNPSATQTCKSKYGNEFADYIEKNKCTKETAAYFRGEISETPNALKSQSELSLDEISCFTYKKGKSLDCELVEGNEEADNFCATTYGTKYLPYKTSNYCSVEKSESLIGFASRDELVGDLKSQIAEAKAIMFMIDREDMKQSLAGLISHKPMMGENFYNPVMKGLLSKLNLIKAELEKRSQLKIKMSDKMAVEFVNYTVEYLKLMSRVYKVYAHLAHKNHKALKTYKFENLDFLNLVVSKPIALEVMNKYNLKAKNLENGLVEFTEMEQSKQLYEYNAISEPRTKVDYAKLVSFLGLRENITNIWALDKISQEDLLKRRIYNYGNFLSFRKQSDARLKNLPSIKENREFDIYYRDYLPRMKDLYEETLKVNVLDSKEAYSMLKNLYASSNEMMDFVGDDIDYAVKLDLADLLKNEKGYWREFAYNHFQTIVLVGDDVLNKENIIDQITKEAFKRRKQAIVSEFQALYVFFGEKESLEQFSQKLDSQIDMYLQLDFSLALKRKLRTVLRDYNIGKSEYEANLEEKKSSTLELVKKHAKIASEYTKIENKLSYKADIKPITYQDLVFLFEHRISNQFLDIKKTLDQDENLANILSDFFNKVAEKFNKKHVAQSPSGAVEMIGTEEEMYRTLRESLYEVAHSIYKENNFEVAKLAAVPNEVMLAREKQREQMTNNPYMISVYKDGTPVVLHINNLYKAFLEDTTLVLSDRDLIMRTSNLMGIKLVDELTSREIPDAITDGTFGRPLSYVFTNGEIYHENNDARIDNASLKRLFFMSLDYTKSEMAESLKLERKKEYAKSLAKAELYEDVSRIKTSKKLFARVFELFKVPFFNIKHNIPTTELYISRAEQKALAESKFSQAYSENPLTRLELETAEEKEKIITPVREYGNVMPYKVSEHNKKERSLLLKVAYHAYDSESASFDDAIAMDLIDKVIDRARRKTKQNLSSFLNLDYLKIKDNEQFARAYKASNFIRQRLKDPTGTTISNAKKIQELDEEVRKDVRTKLERVNEDYVEPAMLILGALAITAVLITVTMGSLGAAAPAIFGLFISAEFIISAPLVAVSLYTRVNSGFIEAPAQLKFQKSLAHSQITENKVTDYDLNEEERKAQNLSNTITIGLMPLELLYGKMLVSHIRKGMGVHAAKAYNKLSGVKVRPYSAPATSLTNNKSYSEMRQKYGTFKGAYKYSKVAVTKAKARLPKYREMPEELRGTNLLRVGLLNAMKKLKMHNNPWSIRKDIQAISGKYKDKISEYNKFIADEAEVIAQIEARGTIDRSKVVALEAHYNKFYYTMKSGWNALKNKRFGEYLINFKTVRNEMKYLKQQLLRNKVIKLENLVDKIDDVMKVNAKVKVGANDTKLIQELLNSLSDEDLTLLGEVYKKSFKRFFKKQPVSGEKLDEFSKVFKQYEEVSGLDNFRPTSYLYGKIDEEFRNPNYVTDGFYTSSNQNIVFKSSSEDIVNFYESIIQQHGFKDETTDALRKKIENMISDLFIIDAKGNRIYRDQM